MRLKEKHAGEEEFSYTCLVAFYQSHQTLPQIFFFFSGSGSRLHATYLLLQTNFLGPSSYRWCRFLSVPMFNQSALHPELVLSGALWTPLIVHLGVDWKSLLRASAVACSYHLPQFLVFNTSNSARQQLGLILILLPVCGLSNIEKKL